jgi:uncharacterized protein
LKVLFAIGHPADIHFFRHSIEELNSRGHQIDVIVREKEITDALLEKFCINHRIVTSHKKGIAGKVVDFSARWIKNYRVLKSLKPDIAIGVGDFCLAQIGKLLKYPTIVFTDIEHVKFDPILTFPFADCVLTPASYTRDIGRKQIRLQGYKELAYLYRARFKPDAAVLNQLGLVEGQKYIIVRFVSHSAVHDIGIRKTDWQTKAAIINEFNKHAKVHISSEDPLPTELIQYKIPISPEKIHHAMYYADLLYGESSTMAAESACLGTPAIFVDDNGRGYTDELDKKYGLVFNYPVTPQGLRMSVRKGIEIIQQQGMRGAWRIKRDRMLEDKIDVTAFLVWLIEKYPESAKVMKENPDYQQRFCARRGAEALRRA